MSYQILSITESKVSTLGKLLIQLSYVLLFYLSSGIDTTEIKNEVYKLPEILTEVEIEEKSIAEIIKEPNGIKECLFRIIKRREHSKSFLFYKRIPPQEGKSDRTLWLWANDVTIRNQEFVSTTQKELEQAKIEKKDIRQLYHLP